MRRTLLVGALVVVVAGTLGLVLSAGPGTEASAHRHSPSRSSVRQGLSESGPAPSGPTIQGSTPAPAAAFRVPRSTIVAHPTAPVSVWSSPGGTRAGRLATTWLGGPTWVPVWSTSGSWLEIGLPGGGGDWIRAHGLKLATDPYAIVVDRSRRQLTVYRDAHSVGTWPAAIGSPATPTPAGRTFVTADIQATGIDAIEAPLVRPLAETGSLLAQAELGHGAVLAIHGWEDKELDSALWRDGHGLAVTHGCVRVPASAMTGVLARVPNGTPVWVV